MRSVFKYNVDKEVECIYIDCPFIYFFLQKCMRFSGLHFISKSTVYELEQIQ